MKHNKQAKQQATPRLINRTATDLLTNAPNANDNPINYTASA